MHGRKAYARCRKKAYVDRIAALIALARHKSAKFHVPGQVMHAYYHAPCGAWHLGHRKTEKGDCIGS